ncbi:glycosyltransferase family 4 protein [Desulfococcus sp.]|uniref:glycosyltransferase family 4 protein n=1 Tax=Desulfococcus sp. TaxID=2025834 RepID=UPI003593837D
MSPSGRPVLGMVLKGYPRISETFITNEILLLESLGFSIHLFSMRHPRESFTHKSVMGIRAAADYLPQEILRGFFPLLYHNLRLALRHPVRYLGAAGAAFKRFLRSRKSATVKHLLQAGYLVGKLLPGRDIVHLHAHFAHSPTSVAMFASRLSGIPFSFTAHAKDIYTSDPRQIREKMALSRFVVTCTDYNRRHLIGIAAGSGTPVHRVYHGIDLGLFVRPPEPRLPEMPYRILTIARIVPKKGLQTVYRALKILRDRGIRFEHTLIGDGDDRKKILAFIAELGLSDACRWLGTLPHEVVLTHYRNADLFVLGCEIAENGDRDGIPNVYIEAMAMGVPVVGTRVSAASELISHGRTGLLVPPGAPGELAAAVHRLLTDDALRARVTAAARDRVCRDFDNRQLIRGLAEIYRREQPLL